MTTGFRSAPTGAVMKKLSIESLFYRTPSLLGNIYLETNNSAAPGKSGSHCRQYDYIAFFYASGRNIFR